MSSAVEEYACLMSGTMRLKSLMFDIVFSVGVFSEAVFRIWIQWADPDPDPAF
jgi:hypothetical protein